ncbi:MAG: hypothetical protein SGPRY_002166, partial [Prymnesium sp.]
MTVQLTCLDHECIIQSLPLAYALTLVSTTVVLNVEGSASLQLSARSVGLFEAFYSSIKPHKLFVFHLVLASPGKLSEGSHELDFEFEVKATEGEKLLESYHGVYINVQYVITVETRRGMLAKNLKRSVEFIVEPRHRTERPQVRAVSNPNFQGAEARRCLRSHIST